ncbi:MAG: hypothetical protein H7Z17_17200 [Fuerstia sp.]|nr:hypothetical protein [Fuerstiella sp.]
MKWSLPLVELSRPAAHCALPLSAALTWLAFVLPFTAGCSALPVMQSAPVQVAMKDGASSTDGYTDAEKLRLSQLPTTPDFDVVPVAVAAPLKEAALAPLKEEVTATKAAESATPTAPGATPRSQETSKPVEVAAVAPSATTPDQKTIVAGPPIVGAGQTGVTPSVKPSSLQLPMLRIDAPKPFAWTSTGKTTGDRSFQTVTIGDDGYRTLVIGSVAGNDPLALELVEQLARHLHNDKTILGGFQTTILRTLNPDGEALHNVLNAKGQYINHGFPKDNGIADGNQPAEVTFLLSQIQTLQPQRVIHVRTIEGDGGLVAASSGCMALAKNSGEWLGFRVISLPGKAVSGSLERHLASSARCEVMAFAIPATAKKTELWDRYGDALQNLLMGEDVDARELARQQRQQSSANNSDAADR